MSSLLLEYYRQECLIRDGAKLCRTVGEVAHACFTIIVVIKTIK